MRVEFNEDANAKSPATLFPISGKQPFNGANLLSGPIIGAWSNRYRTFWVAANETGSANLYEVFEDGTFSLYGQIALGGNPATMRANGDQLVVCSAGNVYVATGFALYQPIVNYTSGVANVNGAVVTWVSSIADETMFTEVQAGDLLLLPPSGLIPTSTAPYLYTVATVAADGLSLTLTEAAGVLNNYAYQIGSGPTCLLQGAMVEYIDGYFIVNVPDTITYRISHLFDGSTWDALDYQSKSGSVDDIAAVLSFSGYLALIGDTNSVEIWGDSGNAQFPFARVSGQNLNVGTESGWSVQKLTNGSVIWLMNASNGGTQVVRSLGGAPQRISNHAMEYAMRLYPRVDDAISSTYVESGHEFYRIDFPTANRTWEYDSSSNLWVELGVETPQNEVYGCDVGRYRVHVTWPSGTPMDLVGDYTSGNIYQVSPLFFFDNGNEIPVMRIAPHINTGLQWASAPAFALDCELGTVDPSLLGPDGKLLIPQVSLAYSNDGTRTWLNAGTASLGRTGEYEGTYLSQAEQFDVTPSSQTNPQGFEARPLWSGLGAFWISRTYKIKSTASQLRAVYNGLADVA